MSHQINLHDGSDVGVIANIPGHGIMLACGATVPADAVTGYGTGCLFLHTDAADQTTIMYANIGSLTSANFNLVTVASD